MKSVPLWILLTLSTAVSEQSPAADVAELARLAGQWNGSATTNGVTGSATRFWTAPVEGVVSTTFQWHVADQDHVHLAFSVVESTAEGPVMRFIHRGRDFEPFEEAPLQYDLVEANEQGANFRCRTNCRAHHRIERTGADTCRASWIQVDGRAPPFVVEYRRVVVRCDRSAVDGWPRVDNLCSLYWMAHRIQCPEAAR